MVPMGLQHDIPTNIHISTNWACTYNLKKKKQFFSRLSSRVSILKGISQCGSSEPKKGHGIETWRNGRLPESVIVSA